MANNVTVKDSANGDTVLKTTDNAGVHTPHHNVDSSALPTGAATSAKQDTQITAEQAIQAAVETLDDAISGTEMQVDVVAALPAGTNNIGDVDVASIAAGDNNIGNVDVVSFPAEAHSADFDSGAGTDTTLAFGIAVPASGGAAVVPGSATAGLKVDLGADNDVTVTGTVTVDGSGVTQPVSHAALTELAAAIDTEVQVDVVGALPAGDNNIGNVDLASAIPAGTNNIGDVDVLTLPALAAGTNAIGKLLPPDTDVTGHTNYARKYYTSTGAATDGIIWSPAAGKRWHVVTLFIQVSAAATVTLEDDLGAGDDPVWKAELAANSGVFLVFPEQYPLASGEDAADLLITTSAGNCYVTVTGYEV